MASPRYQWVRSLSRYRDVTTGRLVSTAEVRRVIDRTLRTLQGQTRTLTDDVRAGRVSRSEFALRMRENVKDVHLLSAASARGGWHQMTPQAFGQVGQILREQYGFLDKFTAQVESGEIALDGSFTRRALMYVERGRNTHSRAERQVQTAAGKNQRKNVLNDAAEHCAGPGSCEAETDKGWQDADSPDTVEIGDRICIAGCQCHWEWRGGEQEGSVAVAEPAVAVAPPPTILPQVTPRVGAGAPSVYRPAPVTDPRELQAARQYTGSESFQSGTGDDPDLLRALQEQGFTDPGDLVERDEIDAAIRGGDLEMYRGVGSEDEAMARKFAEDFQSGELFAGKGMSGNGTYVAVPAKESTESSRGQPVFGEISSTQVRTEAEQDTQDDGPFEGAREYAREHEHGWVVRMAMRKDARFGDYDTLKAESETLVEQLRSAGQNTEADFYSDVGRYAVARGFDGYFIGRVNSKQGYAVILNRSALRIQRELLPT